MKTKELIRQLQEADPSGEVEVCVGNVDIHFVDIEPAYYDGTLQVLKRDESKSPYYNIVGGKYCRTGSKVVLHTLSISDAIANGGDFEVDYSELSDERREATKKAHDGIRSFMDNMKYDHELEHFQRWAMDKAKVLTEDLEDFRDRVRFFFEKNVSPDDELPEGGVPMGYSYNTCREKQWEEKFKVYLSQGAFLEIGKR